MVKGIPGRGKGDNAGRSLDHSSNDILAYSVSTPTHLEVAFWSSSVSSLISLIARSSHEDAASLSAKE
jgi:hypothetical protein